MTSSPDRDMTEAEQWRALAIMWAGFALITLPFIWPCSVVGMVTSVYSGIRLSRITSKGDTGDET